MTEALRLRGAALVCCALLLSCVSRRPPAPPPAPRLVYGAPPSAPVEAMPAPAPAEGALLARISGPMPGGDATADTSPPAVPPEAPRIRAGVTDDNASFEDFLAFLGPWSDREDTVGQYRWMPVRDRTRVTVLDARGRVVPDAEVAVLGPDGHPIWTATTYGDGATSLYPELLGLSGAIEISAEHGPARARAPWRTGQDLTLRLDRSVDPADAVRLDVALVVDTTGSMKDELTAIQATLRSVVREVTSAQRPADLRFGAVFYRDKGDRYVTWDVPFTADVETFDAALVRMVASGGGDGPESLNEALRVTLADLVWRSGAARIAFVIADARPHMDYPEDLPYDHSARRALAAGVRVHTVAASGLDATGSLVFRQIAQLTRGRFIWIAYAGHAASAAGHGVNPDRATSNNLDRILADQILLELDGYGRAG